MEIMFFISGKEETLDTIEKNQIALHKNSVKRRNDTIISRNKNIIIRHSKGKFTAVENTTI